jgi:3-carboxy-cis,cis-muconate cycloisomerase
VTFAGIFVPDELRQAVSDEAWLQAMLDFERALAAAEARAGVIPEAAAEAIAASCRAELFDANELAAAGRGTGNPAEPLVRALRERVGGEAAGYVHWGATSQDVMDTAAVLVSRVALGAYVLSYLDAVAAVCAGLAREHRGTVMAGRTLLQQAVPTTFGLKVAGWLVSVLEAEAALRAWQPTVELGGAAGTLAALGDDGLAVLSLLAEELDLPEPTVPWHTNRVRFAQLCSGLAILSGVLAKIGRDVALLAQTEVAEIRQSAGTGGSSTMPHKRNPVGSSLAMACAEHVRAACAVVTAGVMEEHERGLGGWQAEWGALSHALAYTGGAAVNVLGTLDGLEVDPDHMRANLSELTAAEHASFVLARRVGRAEAHELIGRAAQAESFREGLIEAGLSPDEADRALDPGTYLGAADAFVDRALALYEAGT